MNEHGAILLAGGQSSRMGRDKAGLQIGGQTLLERLIRTVSPLVSHIVTMLSFEQKLPFIPPTLRNLIDAGRDSKAGQGPMRGIVDALPLLSSNVNIVFVLTCDLPYLTTAWLMTMQQSLSRDIDIVCADNNGFINPLIAVYRKDVLSRAPDILASGQRSCLALLNEQSLIRLPAPPNNPLVCQDINTPEEYQEALRNLSATSP